MKNQKTKKNEKNSLILKKRTILNLHFSSVKQIDTIPTLTLTSL